VSWNYFQPRKRSVEDASVILEKIEAVKKLITVEGHFSEIYNYSEYQGYCHAFWEIEDTGPGTCHSGGRILPNA
jgi:hypothetical protein